MAQMRELTDEEVFGPLITARQPVAQTRELTDEEVFGGQSFTPVQAEAPAPTPDPRGAAQRPGWSPMDILASPETRNFVSDMFSPDPKTHYSNLLPLARGADGQVRFAPPQALQEAAQAVQSPARVIKGEIPESEIPEEARNMAMTIAGAGNASSLARAPVEATVMGMNMMRPVAKGTAKAVTAVAQPVLDLVDVDGAVGRALAKRMMQDNPGMTFDEAFAKTQKTMADLGDQSTLADTGEAMSRLNRNMTQGPGETANLAKEVLGGRQLAEKTRQLENVRENISNKEFYDVAAEAQRTRRKAGPLFEQANAKYPNVTTPKLDLYLQQEPQVKDAMGKGLTILRGEASNDGVKFDPSTFGVNTALDADGNIVVEAVNGTPLQLWHATKRGIDKLINAKKNAIGQLDKSDPDVIRLINTRKGIDEELKAVTGGPKGEYARANKIASEGYKLEEALEAGRKFVDGDEQITEKMFKALTPKEKDAYRAGVAQRMLTKIRKDTSGLTPREIMSALQDESGVGKKLAVILPTKEQYNRFMSGIERDLKFRETNRNARAVSQTGSIAMEEGQIAGDALAQAGQVVKETADKGIAGGVTQAMRWGLNQLKRIQMPQGTRDRLGKALLGQDQAAKDEALRLIRQAQSQGWRYTP